MATFYTDPTITGRGLQQTDPMDNFARLLQIKALMADRQLKTQEGSIRLAELRRQVQEGEAQRGALSAGVNSVNIAPLPITGAGSPAGPPQTVNTFDRQAALNALAQGQNKYLVPGMQEQFDEQDAAHKKSVLELADKIQTVDEKTLKNLKTHTDMLGSLAESIIINPNSYGAAKQQAEQSGLVQSGRLPEQFSPEMLPQLQAWANQARDVKDVITAEETKRHNQATEAEKNKPKPGVDVPFAPAVEQQKIRIGKATKEGDVNDIPAGIVDPNSQSILAQTGLSLPAFMTLTGDSSKLPRDKATRSKAFAEAQQWANKRGVDISTMGSQYKTYNDVLSKNIARLNNTKIMEQELEGTIQNLQGVVNDKDLGSLRFANVAKVWAGQETNDQLAQQYAMHLYQLRNELAAYGAATQGRSGNEINVSDQHEAETAIRNGISKGSLAGLATAVKNSTAKMGTVMQSSVDRSRKAVWDLFGVGDKYKGTGKADFPVTDPRGVVHHFADQNAADAFKKAAGIS